MSAARIDSASKVTILDGKVAPNEVVTEADVQEPAKLTRLLTRLLRDVAELKRLFVPKRIDFEDVLVGSAAATTTLQHNMGGRVRWWVVDWQPSVGGAGPALRRDAASTTSSTLVLFSGNTGTATIRVESAG